MYIHVLYIISIIIIYNVYASVSYLAIEKYLTSYLEDRNLSIALPRIMEMEEVDTGSPSRFVISNGHVQYIVYYVVYMYLYYGLAYMQLE